MNRDNKKSMKNAKIWQRHALAQACFLLAAGLSTAAWADGSTDPQDFPQTGSGAAARVNYNAFGAPGTNSSQGLFWATGYNNQIGGYQYGSGKVESPFGSLSLYQRSPAGPGAVPTAINNNSFLSYAYGNQQTLARSLSLLNRTSVNDDGQLALNLQIMSATDALTTNSTQIQSLMTGSGRSVYITQTGNASANQSVSGNTFGATTISNLMDTSLSGALPFLYDSEFKGQSSLQFADSYFQAGGTLVGAVDPSFFRGTRSGVNITNLQSTFNIAGNAFIQDTSAKITVTGTPPVSPAAFGVFANNINLSDNNILAKSILNSATSIVQASAASSAFSGSVAVTNGQSNLNTNTSLQQIAKVQNGDVMANVQGGATETRISGTVNVNGNTVSANATGNSAGARNSSGTLLAGNAIVFEGNADIQGPIGSKAWDEQLDSGRSSLISSVSTDNDADLLVNSLQRNMGLTFLASVNPSEISSKADNLISGAISQNGNTQSATVSGNLVGNLITAGTGASIGNIQSNAAIVNLQDNKNVTGTATVEDAVQKVSVGRAAVAAVSGTISLNNNTIQATAEGNAASSAINLKASALSVGQGMGLTSLMTPNTDTDPVTTTEYLGSSFAAVSVLNAQKNSALSLTSNLENSSVSAEVKIPNGAALSLSGSAVSVNGNRLLSTASGNDAGNSVTLSASTAPSLTASVGNTQFNSGNVSGAPSATTFAGTSIEANAGFDNALSVGFSGLNLASASSVGLNTNSIGASAKGSNASNTLSVTAENASGAGESDVFSDNAPSSQANDPNAFSSVRSYADLGLANAQAARGTTTAANVNASVTGAVAAVNNSGLTVNSNSVSAAASLNSATNSVALNIGNLNGMTASLASAQTTANSGTTTDANSKATAQTNGAVSLTATGAVEAVSSMTLASNTVSASASANTASNTLALTGTTASGRDINLSTFEESTLYVAGASNKDDGTALAAADFSLANKQKIVASSALTVYSADTTATVKAVVGGALTDASVTVRDNITSARSSGNDASNTISMAVDNLSKPNTALASMQTMDTAKFTATVTDTNATLGTGVSITGTASNAQVAVTGNQVKASALGNVVTNRVEMSGTNLTGSTNNFNEPVVSTSVVNISSGEGESRRFDPGMKSEATVALANLQTSTGNSLSAKLNVNTVTVGDDDFDYGAKIGINTGAVGGASTLSVTSNTMATQVFNNSANNRLALDVTTANAVSAGLVSAQLSEAVLSTALDSTTNARIQIESGAVSGASSLSVGLNRITSTTVANVADNALIVQASTASGRSTQVDGYLPANAKNLGNVYSYNHAASADYALVNEQLAMGTAPTLTATTNGELQVSSSATVTNASLTLSDNTASSFASVNNASNWLQLNVTNLSAARAGLTNAQQVQEGSTETVTNASAIVLAGGLSGAKVSANSNQLTSTALGNEASNRVLLAGTTASNSTSFGAVNTRTGTSSDVNADMALASQQSSSASTLSAAVVVASTVGTINVAKDNDSGSLSVITANSNSLLAASTVNSGTNTVGLNLQNSLTGMAAGLSSTQTAAESVATATAITQVGIFAEGTVSDNSSLTVNSNTVSASATANTATNTVNVAASTASGRNSYSGAATSAISSSESKVTADYAIANKQSVTGISEEFKASTNAFTGVLTSTVTSSSVAVNDNKTLASVLGNKATNGVNVEVTNLTQANTGLASAQTLGSGVSFAAEVNKTIDDQAIGITATVLTGASLSVNNNALSASAVGNQATNTIAQEVTNATGTAIANAIPKSTSSATATSAVSAPANLGLSSLQQSTGNPITATLGDSGKVTSVSIFSGNVSGASALSVVGNTLSTEVFNNSASNSVALRGTNLTTMTAGLASGQVVTAVDNTVLTATTIADAGISVGGTVGAGGQLTASSNTIKSLVVGNSAGNGLSVNATNASGQNFSSSSPNNTANANSTATIADFALASQQVLSGSAMEAKTLGTVSMGSTGNVTGASLTANDNTVSAYTSANNVSSGLDLRIGTLTAARAGLSNTQTLSDGATVKATVEEASVVVSIIGDLSAVQASLAGNTVKATALGNVADNQFALIGSNATAGTQAGSKAYAGTSTYVTSGLALANLQNSSDQTVTAKNGTDDTWTEIALNAGSVDIGSRLALTGNAVSSLAYANNATNGMTLGVSNLNGLTAGVANTQNASATAAKAVSAETFGRVQADLGNVSTSTLTVSNNTVSASSMANYAGNSLRVNAQQITGKGGVSNYSGTDSSNPGVEMNGDLALASSQSLSGSGAAVTAKANGWIDAAPINLTSSNLTVSNNSIVGYAAGNNVGNALEVNTAGLTGAVVALANAQKSGVGVSTTTTGFIRGFGDTVSGAQMAVNDNQVMSTAVGNAAGNTLTVVAANATGVSTVPRVYPNLSSVYGYADVNLVNAQSLSGDVNASTGKLDESESAAVTLVVWDEAQGTSTLSLNRNAVTASAFGNSATNAVALRVSNALSMGSAVGNSQNAVNSTVSAEIFEGRVFADLYPLTATNLSVNNNRIASSALANTAINTLIVSASSATGRGGDTETYTSSTSADHTVGNRQSVFAGTVSSSTTGRVDTYTYGRAVSGTNVSQNANEVSSYASANQATNRLSMAVANSNTATAAVSSYQEVSGATTVAATSTGTVLFTTKDEAAGNISNATLSLNENQVSATAVGNMVINELLASGATLQSAGTLAGSTLAWGATSDHLSVSNYQEANGTSVTATTQLSNTEPYAVRLNAGTVTDSALSLNSNTIAAQATNNSATNKLASTVTNTLSTSVGLVNVQSASSTASATVRGEVVADVAGVSSSSIAVNSNAIQAKADSNSAVNTLTVAGTSHTGSGLTNRSSSSYLDDDAQFNLQAEIALANAQTSINNSASATVVGSVALTSNTQAVVDNTLSMNANAVTASANGNSASNRLELAKINLTAASAGLASAQALISSNVTANTTGTVGITTGALGVAADASANPEVLPKSVNLSIKDNTILSTAQGNVVSNTLVVSATTATSAGPSTVATRASNAGEAVASADFSLVNVQGAVGNMSATTTGAVGVTSAAVANSTLSMTGNAIQAVAQANSGTNRLTLEVDQPTALTAAVASRQNNDGTVSAITTTGKPGAVSIAVDSLTQSDGQTLSVVMSGNTVSAAAGKNEAFNTLTVSGGKVSGRNNAVSGEAVGTASVTGVDYSVVNAQAAINGVSASVNAATSGISSSGTLNAGTITLSDNIVSASANANTAINALTLAATNRLEASGAINNVQTVSGGTLLSPSMISATVESASLTVTTGSGTGAATVTSTGNLVKATASANLATNALNATAANGITSAGAERGTGFALMEGETVIEPAKPQTPTYAVLNSQHTNAGSSVVSAINGFSMGGSALNGALNGGSVAVTGNVIQSLAYGNSASNSIQVSALPATLNTASASITNVQYNLASVSASIAGVNVQASGSNSVSSSGVNISGNTVTAMAVGNRASNIIIGR